MSVYQSKKRIVKNSQKNGFSLLELLLVITLLGILSTLSISFYQKRSESTKISKASIEMQGILQAASAFYITGQSPDTSGKNRWPANTGETADLPNYFLPYLPIPTNTTTAKYNNPWGSPYFIDGQQNYKFKIKTSTPSSEIAKKLANSIPYGIVDPTNSNAVLTYIPAPGQQLTNEIIIKDIGRNADNNTIVDKPKDCPLNTSPDIITAVSYIRADLSNISSAEGPYNRVIASPITLLSTAIDDQGTQWKINISFKKAGNCGSNKTSCKDVSQSGSWNDDKVKAKIMYIVYCKPNAQ